MKIEDREKAIAAFTDNADCRILLMSHAAGGVALSLTVASYVRFLSHIYYLIYILNLCY
jgi:SNF2 family DNA or RNA helicase